MTPSVLATIHGKAFSATRAWAAQEFAELLDNPGILVHGDTKSFVLIRVVADEAEVLTLATDPAYQRQGLARVALHTGEQHAQAAGATTMFLEVAEDNTAAQALYIKAGYAQVGRRAGYYLPKDAAPIAALVLRKDLKTR